MVTRHEIWLATLIIGGTGCKTTQGGSSVKDNGAATSARIAYACNLTNDRADGDAAEAGEKFFVLVDESRLEMLPEDRSGLCVGTPAGSQGGLSRFNVGGSECPADGFDMLLDQSAFSGNNSSTIKVEANDSIDTYACNRLGDAEVASLTARRTPPSYKCDSTDPANDGDAEEAGQKFQVEIRGSTRIIVRGEELRDTCVGRKQREANPTPGFVRYSVGGPECGADGYDMLLESGMARGTQITATAKVDANDSIDKYRCVQSPSPAGFSNTRQSVNVAYNCHPREPRNGSALEAGEQLVVKLKGNRVTVLADEGSGGTCVGKPKRARNSDQGFKRFGVGGSQCAADGYDLLVEKPMFKSANTGTVKVDANDSQDLYDCSVASTGSGAGNAQPITIVDDNGDAVALSDLRNATTGDGSTFYTYTFTGSALTNLQVAVLVWNASFGPSSPHGANLDGNGNLRGAAGRIPIFETTSRGGKFQIIPNE